MRYYIIAGEASGDLHGSNLIKGLRAEDPEAEFRLWGGDMMLGAALGDPIPQTEPNIGSATPPCPAECSPAGSDRREPGDVTGVEPPSKGAKGAIPAILAKDYRDGAVMGFTEVMAKAGKLLGNIRFCKSDILAWKPDVVILIDYPGFNMRIAKFCHSKGIKGFYYILFRCIKFKDRVLDILRKVILDPINYLKDFFFSFFLAKSDHCRIKPSCKVCSFSKEPSH